MNENTSIIESNETTLLEAIDSISDVKIIIYSLGDDKVLFYSWETLELTGSLSESDLVSFIQSTIIPKKEMSFTDCINESVVKFNIGQVKNELIILVTDITKYEIFEKKSNEVTQLNNALQTIYEQYADDTIMISDKNGHIEFCGQFVADNCGVTVDYIMSKTVYELEKEKVFYPSVSRLVIETNQPQVILQKTKLGTNYVTVGSPILDNSSEVKKVVSITRDYSQHLQLASIFSQVQEENTVSDYKKFHEDTIVTCNESMMKLVAFAKHVAEVNTTVLITGETGTGKEVFARVIANNSERANAPFIKVNCGAISPNIFESELFGYESGSFTGANRDGKIGLIEAANGGTLFLDEVSELPIDQQVKLLQVLQEKSLMRVGGTELIELDIRIISATNKDLESMVRENKFREDLYYRLNVVPLNIPPLRERTDDIALLLNHFLKVFNSKYGKAKLFSQKTFNKLCTYDWPGNVRELENTVERLVVTSMDEYINLSDIPRHMQVDNIVDENFVTVNELVPLQVAVENVEKKMITLALKKYGNGKKAAEALGINQSTISRKMNYYNIVAK